MGSFPCYRGSRVSIGISGHRRPYASSFSIRTTYIMLRHHNDFTAVHLGPVDEYSQQHYGIASVNALIRTVGNPSRDPTSVASRRDFVSHRQ
jgi:hypothetical protein